MHLDARLYSSSTAAEVASAAAEGAAAEIFSLIDRLAAQLLAARQEQGPAARVSRLAAVTTESFPALKAYLAGESAYRDGRIDDAARAFRSAADEDPAFALAWYRLSIVSDWLVDAESAAMAAMTAAEHAGRLSKHDRRLVEAHAAYSCGDGELAERRYRDILRRHPDDLEAWTGLAETEFHYGPLLGRSRRASATSWQRVVALEPSDFNAHLHLARLELYDRDFAALATRADRLERLLAGTAGMHEVRFHRANLPAGEMERQAFRGTGAGRGAGVPGRDPARPWPPPRSHRRSARRSRSPRRRQRSGARAPDRPGRVEGAEPTLRSSPVGGDLARRLELAMEPDPHRLPVAHRGAPRYP